MELEDENWRLSSTTLVHGAICGAECRSPSLSHVIFVAIEAQIFQLCLENCRGLRECGHGFSFTYRLTCASEPPLDCGRITYSHYCQPVTLAAFHFSSNLAKLTKPTVLPASFTLPSVLLRRTSIDRTSPSNLT